MANKCFLLLFTACNDVKGHSYYCVDTVGTAPGSCNVVQVINGVNTGIGAKELNFIQVPYAGSYPIPTGYETRYDSGYYGSACDMPVVTKYDCLNGNCVESTEYKTPGIYQSLSDCQAVCANGGACASGKKCVDPTTFCPDGKVCLDQGEFDSVEALISKIGSEVC